ncbi:MAG: phosphate ABC transporter, permease protein PstA [Devosia sp. 67-54]|uniref:phosphate ABC transporter permease PstA n=1 Tax=unclassified Devosia TaxID=196773 RepID=UPI00086E67AF|nr:MULTISPECIES: phosphate ABC transporter permease PstA [unclassified Devosia]MBN9307038.1 phosphate ABC transporter permease PstA [Devosia sp.]ODU61826.1 MAG: phosphate ABC transporter, permease protein PstA [Acetobacteraceae bacterium SCN 69-10]OJX16883.1 MAG: phosphate ABC transporter, permease protein PstA [Devosia sp. 67-54]
MSSYAARRTRNSVAMLLAIVAAVIGLVFLFLILATLLVKGFTAISPQMFLENTPPPGEDGGLLNAIVGSLAMTVIAIVVATPVGILAGTFLSEYSRGHWLGEAAKFVNDILLSAPSIIIGLFVYTVVVVPVGHFSAWAGAASLGLIALPVINRTTQDMLGLVPNALREAAAALGAPRWKSMVSVIYRAAMSGILTGVLLAIARVTGETAPLLFTALNNQFFSTDLGAPMANLPVVIFQFATSPYDDWQKLAWGGALLITVAILALNIVARWVAGRGNQR